MTSFMKARNSTRRRRLLCLPLLFGRRGRRLLNDNEYPAGLNRPRLGKRLFSKYGSEWRRTTTMRRKSHGCETAETQSMEQSVSGNPVISAKLDRTATREWRENWPVVAVGMLGMVLAGLPFYSQGLFMAPLQQSFGWSRAEVSLGPTIYTILTAFTVAFSGLLTDRLGPRRLAIPGLFLLSLNFAALGLLQGPLWQWYMVWAFIALTSPLIGATVWTSAVVSYFSVSRGLAIAVTLAGLGMGSFLTPIATQFFFQRIGWRWTYVALPATYFVVLLPLTLLFFRDQRERGAVVESDRLKPAALVGLPIREGFQSNYFWRLAVAPALFCGCTVALIVHFVAMVTDKGLDRSSAAFAVGIVGITSILGRVTVGFLLDRFHGAIIAAVMFAAPILSAVILLHYDGTMSLAVVAAMVLGFALGAEIDILGYLATRYLGTRHFSTFFGVLLALANASAGICSYVAGTIYDKTGDYTALLWGVMPVFALSSAIMASFGRYPSFDPIETEKEEADLTLLRTQHVNT
jgi:MFS family permease